MLAIADDLQREIERPYAEPIHVFEFVLPSRTAGQPPLTLRLSDRYVPRQLVGMPTTGVIQEALAFVQDFGVVGIALNPTDAGGAPTTAEPVFFNTKPIAGYARLGDIDADYEFAGARVTLSRLGLDTPLAVLFIEEPADVGDTLLRLRMSDITLSIEDRSDLITITRALFPFADPAAIDQTIPIAIGSLDRVPALCIETGGRTSLSAAVDVGATLLEVTDGLTGFSEPPFAVQIDSGEIVTVSDRTPTTLTVSATAEAHPLGAAIRERRAPGGLVSTTLAALHNAGNVTLFVVSTADFPQSGTFTIQVGAEIFPGSSVLSADHIDIPGATAVSHAAGTTVLLLADSVTRYVIAENRGIHATRAVPAVLNHGVRLLGGFTVTLNDRDLIPGRSFVTMVLTELPSTVLPTIVDSIGVTSSSPTTLMRHGTNLPKTISGGDGANGAVTMPTAPDNITNVNHTCAIRQTAWGTTVAWAIKRNGVTIWSGVAGTFPVSASGFPLSNTTYGSETFAISVPGGAGTYTIVIDDVQMEVEATIVIEKTGGVSSIEDEPAITAAIEGVQDDDLGSITGIPRTLLEVPGHVMRFLATAVYGVPASELGSRWDAAIAQQAGLRWAFLFGADGPPKFSDVRALAGEQSNSRVTMDHGRLDMVWRPTAPAADLTLDYERDIWAEMPATLAKINPTQRFNRVVASAQRDYAGASGYRYTVTREDLSQAGFDRPIETALELPWVQDAATADALAEIKLREVKVQPRELALVGYQRLLGLQTMDHVRMVNHPGLAAHGGDATVFRVLAKRYQLGDENPARIGLTAIEANP